MKKLILGVMTTTCLAGACFALSHNLLTPWKNPPRCSPPQTPLFAFYNKQNETMIFDRGDAIEIWCQAGVRSYALKYGVHLNRVNKPFIEGAATEHVANLYTIRIPTADLAPGFYDVKVRLETGFDELFLFDPEKKPVKPEGVCTFGWKIDQMAIPDSKPADFDAFWREALRKYNAVALDLRIESEKKVFRGKEIDAYNLAHAALPGNFDPEGSKYDEVVSYKVSWAGPDGGRVYAWAARPNVEGMKFPALLVLPGAGTGGRPRPLDHARHGYFALEVQIQGFDVEVEGNPKVEGYAGCPRSCDPKDYCWYNIYLRAYKGVEALVNLPEVDAKKIVCVGGSQGGRLSYAVSALDPRVAATIPCISHGANVAYLHWTRKMNAQCLTGVGEAVDPRPNPQAVCESYYDPLHFSPRMKNPIFANMGVIDPVSPAYSVWAVFTRAGSADKTMTFVAGHGHDWFASFDKLAYKWLARTLNVK